MKRSLLFSSLATLALACSDDTTQSDEGGSGPGPNSTVTSGPTGGNGAAGGNGSGGESSGTAGNGGADPFAGPLVNLQEVDFGAKEVDKVHKINLPDRMVGFTMLAEANGVVGIYSVRAKNKLFAITGFGIPNTGLQSFAGQDIVGAAIPQSDLVDVNPPPAGEWQFRLGADEANPITEANIRLFVRRTEDGLFHGGVIDFNVFVASSSNASQSYLTSVLNSLFANYYAPNLGLTLGNVNFSTIANTSFNTIGSTEEYRQLLLSSAGAGSEPAVNLFVVSGFSGGDLGGVLGIAGGIPGAPVKHGTGMSGVAYDPSGDANYDASVLAHEIGHLGGLFHTTEYQVQAVDPLADTPSCANPQNPNSCPDVSNVMFPIAYGGDVFSPWQAKILQASVLYRGSISEGAPPSGPLPAPLQPNTDFAKPFVGATVTEHVAFRAPKTPVERLLWSHWCARAGDPSTLVLRAAANSGGTNALLDVLRDETALDIARARALRILGRQLSSSREAAALVETIDDVLHGSARHRLLEEAIESLEVLDPARLDALGIDRTDGP